MMTQDGKAFFAFCGGWGPVQVYLGKNKIAGWRLLQCAGGETISLSGTYCDALESLTVGGDSFQEAVPSPEQPQTVQSVAGQVQSFGAGAAAGCGSSFALPQLRAIRDGDGTVLARDFLHVERGAKRAWVERNVQVVEPDNFERSAAGTLWFVRLGRVVKGQRVIGTHYAYADVASSALKSGECGTTGGANQAIWLRDGNLETAAAVTGWLSQQRQAGTPVRFYIAYDSPVTEELPWQDAFALCTAPYLTQVEVTGNDSRLAPVLQAVAKQMEGWQEES